MRGATAGTGAPRLVVSLARREGECVMAVVGDELTVNIKISLQGPQVFLKLLIIGPVWNMDSWMAIGFGCVQKKLILFWREFQIYETEQF